MALLQNDKAIFYHPLDDATETLKAQAWAGTSAFSAGKVSLGLEGVLKDSLGTFGAAAEFVGGSFSVSVFSLSATKFVVVYSDADDSFHGTAKVGTVSGTSITFGAETEFQPALGISEVSVSGCPVSETKFVVAYSFGKAKVGTVSGTDITFGAEADFSVNTSQTSIVSLSASVFVVAYRDGNDSTKGKSQVGTIAGTDITFGATAEFAALQNSGASNPNSLVAFSATKFVVAYRDGADASKGKARVGTVSGTDITFAAAATFNSGQTWISVVTLDATKFVVAYKDAAAGDDGLARVGTVSGTDITYGAKATFETGTAGNVSITALSTTAVVVTYASGGAPNDGLAKIAIVSGTDMTFGGVGEFLGTGANTQSSTTLNATTFVVAYSDIVGGNKGKANVGFLANTAALTGTGASYNSAAAATKVAFAGWLKNPSA